MAQTVAKWSDLKPGVKLYYRGFADAAAEIIKTNSTAVVMELKEKELVTIQRDSVDNWLWCIDPAQPESV